MWPSPMQSISMQIEFRQMIQVCRVWVDRLLQYTQASFPHLLQDTEQYTVQKQVLILNIYSSSTVDRHILYI